MRRGFDHEAIDAGVFEPVIGHRTRLELRFIERLAHCCCVEAYRRGRLQPSTSCSTGPPVTAFIDASICRFRSNPVAGSCSQRSVHLMNHGVAELTMQR